MPESDIVGERKIICQKNCATKRVLVYEQRKTAGIIKEISIFLKVQ